MSQEHVDAVRRSLDAWNRDDFETYSALAHPDIEWTSEIAERMAGDGTVYRGVEGLRRHWDEWREIWTVKVDLTEVIEVGDTVVALAQTVAKGHGIGLEMEQPIGYVFEFEEGMARRVRSYIDPERALEAAGLRR